MIYTDLQFSLLTPLNTPYRIKLMLLGLTPTDHLKSLKSGTMLNKTALGLFPPRAEDVAESHSNNKDDDHKQQNQNASRNNGFS